MLIALCSVKGSPGTTTTTLAVATCWPTENVLVVECDPAGGDLAPRLQLPSTPGLVTLAAAARHHPDPQVLLRHAWRPAGLPAVVCGPAGTDTARGAVTLIAARGAPALRAGNLVVLADCGRVDAGSAAVPILRAADALLVLSHAHPDALTHLAAHLPLLASWNRRPGLVMIGDGRTTAEVEHTLRIQVTARLPRDPKSAAQLCGRRRGTFTTHSPLGASARRLATTLRTALPQLPYPPRNTTHAVAQFGGSGQSPAASGWPPSAIARRHP